MNKIKNVKCFLLDMDGTIYLGDQVIPGALEFLKILKEKNIQHIFLTNNSSKDKEAYIKKLHKLNILAEDQDIFSSGDATIHYLKNNTVYNRIYLLGTPALQRSFEENGFEIITEREKNIDCVVLGFDTTLTYDKLWGACDYVRKFPYIATHPDYNCPIEGNKMMPDIGAIIAFIKAATGIEPKVIGKPTSYMLDSILDTYNLKKEEVCMVGDRLYTDIKMGYDLKIPSILVLSGESSMMDYKQSEVKADFIFSSVKDIIELL